MEPMKISEMYSPSFYYGIPRHSPIKSDLHVQNPNLNDGMKSNNVQSMHQAGTPSGGPLNVSQDAGAPLPGEQKKNADENDPRVKTVSTQQTLNTDLRVSGPGPYHASRFDKFFLRLDQILDKLKKNFHIFIVTGINWGVAFVIAKMISGIIDDGLSRDYTHISKKIIKGVLAVVVASTFITMLGEVVHPDFAAVPLVNNLPVAGNYRQMPNFDDF